MRGFLLVIVVLLFGFFSDAQQYSAKEFLFAGTLTEKKFDNYLSKRFSPRGITSKNDTVINTYNFKASGKKKRNRDSTIRSFETNRAKNYFSFTFFTSSKKELDDIKKELYDEKFFCGKDNDSMRSVLFQKKNITVLTTKKEEEDTVYSVLFQQAELPSPDKIIYAEDLFQFNSHEYLVGMFGEKNVVKDIYYLSDKEAVKCSILFPKTKRQAVFFWQDELNMRKPTTIIIGGNMNTGSLSNYDGLIDENIWRSRDGIYSGMSLYSLVRLNGDTFKFCGKNSTSPYMILPENNGTLNFKKNSVILGCLNPNGSSELDKATVEVEKILQDNLGLYVYMMIFYPQPGDLKVQTDLTRK